MSNDIARSNSLAVLAARIQQEHAACASALQRGLDHAVAAGKLLIEAKAQIPHGQWLAWLRDHCKIPVRTAQRYMEVAPYAAEIKNDKLAHLTGDAVSALAAPRPPDQAETEEELMAWGRERLNAPFTESDVEALVESRGDWFRTKLLHQAGVPALASFALEMREDDLNTLRLCHFDDLWAAAEALAPIVARKGGRALKVDAPDMQAMAGVIAHIYCEAGWMLGGLLKEIKHRWNRNERNISDEDCSREWDDIHAELMKRLNTKIEAAQGNATNATRVWPCLKRNKPEKPRAPG
jgi:hypothetical protein